jgi:hypothetical protein
MAQLEKGSKLYFVLRKIRTGSENPGWSTYKKQVCHEAITKTTEEVRRGIASGPVWVVTALRNFFYAKTISSRV